MGENLLEKRWKIINARGVFGNKGPGWAQLGKGLM